MDPVRAELAVAQTRPDNCCTYCHRPFGFQTSWHGKLRILTEEKDHVTPKCVGGKITVPCCSLCNKLKSSRVFESLVDIQDYLLDLLLEDGTATRKAIRDIRITRTIQGEDFTDAEVAKFLATVENAPASPISTAVKPDPPFLHRKRMPRRRHLGAVPMTVCRQKRLALGMSQDKLAELSGVVQPYISKIELRHDPHPDDVIKVAKVLGVDPKTLMDEVTA